MLRHVTIADLGTILGELDEFWEDPDMEFLHQALYVHEFGDTSVLAERDGAIVGYLLGFVNPEGTGYIHAVAVRREARGRENPEQPQSRRRCWSGCPRRRRKL